MKEGLSKLVIKSASELSLPPDKNGAYFGYCSGQLLKIYLSVEEFKKRILENAGVQVATDEVERLARQEQRYGSFNTYLDSEGNIFVSLDIAVRFYDKHN